MLFGWRTPELLREPTKQFLVFVFTLASSFPRPGPGPISCKAIRCFDGLHGYCNASSGQVHIIVSSNYVSGSVARHSFPQLFSLQGSHVLVPLPNLYSARQIKSGHLPIHPPSSFPLFLSFTVISFALLPLLFFRHPTAHLCPYAS
jgi:hypothetical protein